MAGVWQARLGEIRGSLKRDPSHANAWFWRIQKRILHFLVSRYSQDQSFGVNVLRRPVAPRHAVSKLGADYGRPPKSGVQIRRLLDRIADANRDAGR
jgi:hypothetical protein